MHDKDAMVWKRTLKPVVWGKDAAGTAKLRHNIRDAIRKNVHQVTLAGDVASSVNVGRRRVIVIVVSAHQDVLHHAGGLDAFLIMTAHTMMILLMTTWVVKVTQLVENSVWHGLHRGHILIVIFLTSLVLRPGTSVATPSLQTTEHGATSEVVEAESQSGSFAVCASANVWLVGLA